MRRLLKGDVIPGILTVLFGVFFYITTIVTPNLDFGAQTSDGVPGAGFFPYLLSGTICILGIFLIIRGIKQKGTIQYFVLDEELKKNLRILLLTFLGIIGFLILWKVTGLFLLGVFLFSFYLNKVFGRSWKYALLYALVLSLFIYLVFFKAFSIQFQI